VTPPKGAVNRTRRSHRFCCRACGVPEIALLIIHPEDLPVACFGIDKGADHPVRGLVIYCLKCHATWCVPCLELVYESCLEGAISTLPPLLVARANELLRRQHAEREAAAGAFRAAPAPRGRN